MNGTEEFALTEQLEQPLLGKPNCQGLTQFVGVLIEQIFSQPLGTIIRKLITLAGVLQRHIRRNIPQ